MRYGSKIKRNNFLMFKEATVALENKAHKTLEGTLNLVELAYSTNHAGKQRKRTKEEVINRILRDYMPNSETNSEKIYLPSAYAVVIKRPVGKVMVTTVNGTWKWVVEETYEEIIAKLNVA